jgi:hypothetical protein
MIPVLAIASLANGIRTFSNSRTSAIGLSTFVVCRRMRKTRCVNPGGWCLNEDYDSAVDSLDVVLGWVGKRWYTNSGCFVGSLEML